MEHSTTAIPDGERLGRYRLQREIGRGFSSVVFEAVDLQRQRTVALKVLTFLQNLSPERRGDLSERFAREARAISALSHPNIVAIYEVGHADDGREFIAMEMLAGETLRARLGRDGALPPSEAATITLQLADALQYAHERGIVHRDVKPDNVFVLPDGRIKLMDFGVAHVLSDEALTQTGTVVGSPAYMSPEQINGEHLDGRSDVFSLGVVLAEMVVGHKPFEAPTIPAVMHRILNRPPQMETVGPRVLRRVIEKALSKPRQTRFQSAALLADALRRQVLPELPAWEPTSTVVMPTPALPTTLGRSGDAGRGMSGERPPASRAARRGLAAAGAVLAAGTVLAAAVSLGPFHPSAPPVRQAAPDPTQAPKTASGAVGVVRHIPAYWRRSPASPPHRAARIAVSPKSAALPRYALPPVPPPADSVRIVENKPRLLSQIVATVPTPRAASPAAPKPPAAPLVPKAPQLAVAATASPIAGPFTPHLRPLVVKVGGFRQEQTLSPPTIPPDRPAAPGDQDEEQISPPGTPPASPDGLSDPPSADSIPDTAPRLLHRTPTLYPRSVPEAALGEIVPLRVFIDAEGNVSRAVVIRSSGIPDIDEAAIQTVKDWEYVPAFRGGQPIPGEARARIRFSP